MRARTRPTRASRRLPKLRKWMLANGVNKSRIAAYLGRHKSQITRIFQGTQDFTLVDIYRLALWTGLSLEDLVSGGEAQTLIKVYGERLRSGAENARD